MYNTALHMYNSALHNTILHICTTATYAMYIFGHLNCIFQKVYTDVYYLHVHAHEVW